jgi:BlaI family penicillinase repressor
MKRGGEGMKIKYELSKSEEEIMEYIWGNKEGVTSKTVMEEFNEKKGKFWKKQTVNTFLSRMVNKGLLNSELEKNRYTYYPALTKTEFEQGRAEDVLRLGYEGSVLKFFQTLNGRPLNEKEIAVLHKVLKGRLQV